MSKLKIALTGGIASGKSKVGNILKDLGAAIIDLDVISRKVVMPRTDGLSELVTNFGSSILNDDETLNRSELRNLLLKDKSNKRLIESILHPKILDYMQKEITNIDNDIVVVEIPLLGETGNTHMFDRAIIVDCNKSDQLERLIKRDGINEVKAQSMISAQISREERLKIAEKLPTDIIDNSSQSSNLEQDVSLLYDRLINNK